MQHDYLMMMMMMMMPYGAVVRWMIGGVQSPPTNV